jgi:hypothetical protein
MELTAREQVSLVEDSVAGPGGRVAFSSDSHILTACDATSTRIFWLSDQTRPLRRISQAWGGNPFSDRSSSRVLVQSGDGLRVYELNPAAETARIAAIVGRNLTWDEWNRQFPGRSYSKTFSEIPAHVSVADAFLEQAEAAVKAKSYDRAGASYQAAVFWAVDSGAWRGR